MAGETVITVVGNLVDDPELRFTPSGAAVANFRIASTPRTFDRQTNEWKDGDALFLSCSVWRQAAENVAESLQRGMRVIVQGRLKQRSYETREGEKRTVSSSTSTRSARRCSSPPPRSPGPPARVAAAAATPAAVAASPVRSPVATTRGRPRLPSRAAVSRPAAVARLRRATTRGARPAWAPTSPRSDRSNTNPSEHPQPFRLRPGF